MPIITLTLNPSIDKSTQVEALVAEHKLRCSTPKFEPGGGGINVSRALKRLGAPSLAMYVSGGHQGLFFDELIAKENIQFQPFKIKDSTRENMIVLETGTNKQYRFGMEGPNIDQAEWQALLEQLAAQKNVDFIVASGSLCPGLPANFYAKIAKIAHDMSAKFVLDTSGEALKEAANEGVFLLKPNIGELAAMCGLEEIRTEQVQEKALEIIHKGKCEIVAVSLGAMGAIMVTKDKYVHIAAPVVKKRSTVGAGDSMVAGMVYQLSQQKTIQETIMMGVACGSAATMNSGTELCKLEDVQNLYQWIQLHGIVESK